MEENENNGFDILYQWSSINHIKFARGKWWYLSFLILMAAALVLAFWTSNFLLVIIVVLFSLIVLVSYHQPSKELSILMLPDLLLIDGKELRYRKIENFWFRNLGGINYLYLRYKSNSFSDREISLALLGDANPLKIREILLEKNVDEDLEPEDDDLWAQWVRILRF